jgi:glutamate-ammonia-ligase adenylyltransferase
VDWESRTRYDRFRDAGGAAANEAEQNLLDLLFTQSPYLSNFLIRDPAALSRLANDPYLRREKPREVMRSEIDHLHRYRNREYLRLGARELRYGNPEEVGRELSHLADTCLDFVIGKNSFRFCVMAMGKLGGEELNFSSDIDLIYLSDGLCEGATRLAERVTRAISEITDEGFVFRVDLRLRPDGTRGPLVNTLASLERYYESFGRPWERQAWLKARPCAGDLALGEEALKILEPFIWPRSSDEGVIDQVRAMMLKVRADENDVKLGPGGIREIEFFVQALQLVHSKNRALRERNSRRALDKLLFAGLISEREHRALAEAYVFLRRVEHRLQLDEGRQTHSLPRDRSRLASRLGYSDGRAFEIDLETHRRHVREIYDTLGAPGESPPPAILALLDPFATRESLAQPLSQLGFADSSADEIALLLRRPPPALPLLIHEAAQSPDPDLALRRLVDLAARRGAGFFRLIEANRALARLLMSLFGTSEFLGKALVTHPELVGELLAPHQPGLLPAEPEDRLNALRRIKNEEILRIGLLDVAGELSPGDVSTQLSELAESLIRESLAIVAGSDARIAVVALGKLGARELSYASDLDLIFIFEGDFDVHARIAQKLIHALSAFLDEGRLYQVDIRLRPSGQQGTLVSSLAGFRDYHEKHALTWERQALIKLRAVAGDPALGSAVERTAAEHIWRGPVDAGEISRMRARMEKELARETPHHFNIKSGRGGLVDIEFLTQFLQLRDGRVRARATAQALAELRDLGQLASDDAAQLLDSYWFLRRLENRLRIVHDRAIDTFGDTFGDTFADEDKLARRLGYHGESPGARLLADYRLHRERVRGVYSRYLP